MDSISQIFDVLILRRVGIGILKVIWNIGSDNCLQAQISMQITTVKEVITKSTKNKYKIIMGLNNKGISKMYHLKHSTLNVWNTTVNVGKKYLYRTSWIRKEGNEKCKAKKYMSELEGTQTIFNNNCWNP